MGGSLGKKQRLVGTQHFSHQKSMLEYDTQMRNKMQNSKAKHAFNRKFHLIKKHFDQ